MGIYRHCRKNDDETIVLEEVFTEKRYRCHSGSGYQGQAGEIWFIRLSPPPFEIGDLHVAVTTPYIIHGTHAEEWKDYLDRTVARFRMNPPVSGYQEQWYRTPI